MDKTDYNSTGYQHGYDDGYRAGLQEGRRQAVKRLASTIAPTPQTAAVPPSEAVLDPFQQRPMGMNHLEWYDPLNGGASR